MTSSSTGASRTPRSLIRIVLLLLTGMTAYESLKQWLFPGINIWTSHIVTILFSSVVGTVAGYFALRTHNRYESLATRELAERRSAEELLRRSEERFRSLVDNSEEVVGLLDKNGMWIYASSSVSRLWGYSVAEMLSPREFGAWIHPDEVEEVKLRFRILAESSHVPMSLEFRARFKDGSWHLIQASSVNRLDDPSVGAIVASFREVTEQRKAEAALKSSEERFRTLIERSPVAIGLSRMGKITYVNEKFAEMYRFPNGDELRGRSLTELWAPQFRAGIADRVRQRELGMPTEGEFESIGQRHDGSHFPVHAATGLVQLAEGPASIAFLTDITARRDAEDAVRASQILLERAQDVAKVGSWRWDMTKTPPRLEWSKHLYRLLGLEEGDSRRTDELFLELAHPDDRKALIERRAAMLDGRPVGETFRIRLRHTDGNYRWFRTRGQPQFDEAGNLVEVIGAAQDITDQIEAQELVRKSETMLALGKLVAGVAHEVRNPLFAISGTIDAFEADFGDRSEFHDYAVVLRREIERLTILMTDLLEYGRPVASQPSPGSIGPVIERAVAVCSPLAKERQVKIEVESSDDFPDIAMDSKRLVQVFQNLIQNALQHSPNGGSVVVRIGKEGGELGQLICTVEDSGSGIREQDVANVFEPFFTRRQGGTGLGLSIVERIVEAHGGRVAAANRPHGGAVLTVRLPISARLSRYTQA